MDKDEEYLVREELNQFIMKEVDEKLDSIFETLKDNFRQLVVYPLTVLENMNKIMSEKSLELGFDAMELLIILNPLREATYWFIHEMLKRQGGIEATNEIFNYEDKNFGAGYCETVLSLHKSYLNGKQIGLHRSVAKVKFEEVEGGKYELLFPQVNETYNKEMLYYYGLDDAFESDKEKEKVIEVDKWLFKIFNPEKLVKFPEKIFEYLKKVNEMRQNIDLKLYRLCKKRVEIDVNKIADEIESSVISSKDELISVLAIFYYLSRICMHKYMLETLAPSFIKIQRKNYCDYSKKELIKMSKQVGVKENVIIRYIDYFSLDIKIKKGGFGEFPLLAFGERIIWIPSSIILNDFQFSIVNGHYFKDIKFPKHKETIAKSIEEYIVTNASKYTNIVCTNGYDYAVGDTTFLGKELKGDIDAAIYDKESNILLIIECKWKENVYAFTDDYVKIENAVNKIYRTQLDKHKFYFSLDPQNYDKLFSNRVKISDRVASLRTKYLIVDKRIQFHNREENKHVISTFMLAYFFKKFSEEKIMDLNELVEKIEVQKSNVQYERIPLVKEITVNGKTFI